MVRIRHVHVHNYRCFDRVEFAPGRLTWLAGRNGTGKSSLLDAMAFVADLLRGDDVLHRSLRGAGISGRVDFADLLWDPDAPVHWVLELEIDGASWTYSVELERAGRRFRVIAENAAIGGDSRLERDEVSARWWTGERMQVRTPQPRSLLLAEAGDPLQTEDLATLRAALRGVWLLRPVPLLMHEPHPYEGAGPLHRNGRGLDDFLKWAGDMYASHVARFVQGELADLLGVQELRVVFRDGERRVEIREGERFLPLDVLSDGQHLLAWLAALSTFVPEDLTIALMDEPAVAVSETLQDEVHGYLDLLSETVQVVAATHARRALDEAARSEVFLLRRTPGAPASVESLETATDLSGIFRPGEAAFEVMLGRDDGSEE